VSSDGGCRFYSFTGIRDGKLDLCLSGMKTPAETAVEFCRRWLIWPYAAAVDSWRDLVFEDLDPSVEANTFNFANLNGVIAAASSCLPAGHTLNLQLGKSGMFVATVENESVKQPAVPADKPAEHADLCVAIMEACLEASRKLREVA